MKGKARDQEILPLVPFQDNSAINDSGEAHEMERKYTNTSSCLFEIL